MDAVQKKPRKATLTHARVFQVCKLIEAIGRDAVASMTRQQVLDAVQKDIMFPVSDHNITAMLKMVEYKTKPLPKGGLQPGSGRKLLSGGLGKRIDALTKSVGELRTQQTEIVDALNSIRDRLIHLP